MNNSAVAEVLIAVRECFRTAILVFGVDKFACVVDGTVICYGSHVVDLHGYERVDATF